MAAVTPTKVSLSLDSNPSCCLSDSLELGEKRVVVKIIDGTSHLVFEAITTPRWYHTLFCCIGCTPPQNKTIAFDAFELYLTQYRPFTLKIAQKLSSIDLTGLRQKNFLCVRDVRTLDEQCRLWDKRYAEMCKMIKHEKYFRLCNEERSKPMTAVAPLTARNLCRDPQIAVKTKDGKQAPFDSDLLAASVRQLPIDTKPDAIEKIINYVRMILFDKHAKDGVMEAALVASYVARALIAMKEDLERPQLYRVYPTSETKPFNPTEDNLLLLYKKLIHHRTTSSIAETTEFKSPK